MAASLTIGEVAGTERGQPFLVWGVTGQTAHLMPIRCNGVGVGSVHIDGRLKVYGSVADPADLIYVDSVPRRHIKFADLDAIGRLHQSVMDEVAAEVERQGFEMAIKLARTSPASMRFMPMRADNGPSASYKAQQVKAQQRADIAAGIAQAALETVAFGDMP